MVDGLSGRRVPLCVLSAETDAVRTDLPSGSGSYCETAAEWACVAETTMTTTSTSTLSVLSRQILSSRMHRNRLPGNSWRYVQVLNASLVVLYSVRHPCFAPVQFLVRDNRGPDPIPLSFLLTRGLRGADQGYYRAAHALARIARQMSRQLWRPATESDGIPLDVLTGFMNMLTEWSKDHLQHVGVPSNFEAEWDFVSAVTACTCCLRSCCFVGRRRAAKP